MAISTCQDTAGPCPELKGALNAVEDESCSWRGRLSLASSRRVTSTPDPDAFEKYCNATPISIAILLQMYALLLASSIYTTTLYHDTPPIFVLRYFGRSIRVRGHWNTPNCCIWHPSREVIFFWPEKALNTQRSVGYYL